MLTPEENERATRVGPGTPGGELLRRYWLPIAAIHELTDERTTRFVRLLGEDLVLFRDRSGRVGLLADHCSHRGASLLYGRVEEHGIACAYHGWLYDTVGNVLECPAEPPDSRFHLTVKHRAYPVEPLFGLFWAYLGPAPAPPLRKLDIMDYPIANVGKETAFDANWVQVIENNLDGSHIFVLHQDTYNMRRDLPSPRTVASPGRGIIDDLASLDYQEIPGGIRRTMTLVDGYAEEDVVVFPNLLRRMNMLSVKIPIDDYHTTKFIVTARLGEDYPADEDGRYAASDRRNVIGVDRAEAKTPSHATYPQARYHMNLLLNQDIMAIETQGAISARERWRLGSRDDGVAMFDRILLREIDRVERGLEPLGASLPFVDTHFQAVHAVGVR